MFNKKLIAGSIFALMSTSALAVPSFLYTQGTISQEGSAQLASVTTPVVTVTSGAEYSDDDLIVIDYNVALATGYVPASTLNMYAQCVDQLGTTTNGSAAENGGELTLGLLSSDAAAGSVTYRITDVDYSVVSAGGAGAGDCATSLSSSVGAVVALDAAIVDGPAARAAGAVTGSYSATLPNGTTDIDGGSIALAFGGTTELAIFETQFSDADTNVALAGVIDVTATDPRSEFTSGDQFLAAPGLITLADGNTLFSAASITGVTLTLNGDFSYLVDADLTTVAIENTAWSVNADIDGVGSVTYEATTVTATSITWELTETAGGDALDQISNIEIEFDNGDNGGGVEPISQGAYTYDVAITFTDGGTDGVGAGAATDNILALTTAGAAGSFTLNGSSTIVDNYPLSTAVKHFVWITNTGGQDGGVFATALGGDGAQVMTSCDLGVESPAGEVVSVSDELNDCLTAAGLISGRAQVTVTVNAAAGVIGVYAGYRHIADGDRLNLTQD
jgi:hypothetical protein